MPSELLDVLLNAGPVAVIMGTMWWLERKQRIEYQQKYEALLEGLPERLLKHADDRRESDKRLVENFKKLTRAVWAAIKGGSGISSAPPYRSLPPSGDGDV